MLWGLRWAVLGPHWGPPARASPVASPSASTVRPGSWLGLGREPPSGNWGRCPLFTLFPPLASPSPSPVASSAVLRSAWPLHHARWQAGPGCVLGGPRAAWAAGILSQASVGTHRPWPWAQGGRGNPGLHGRSGRVAPGLWEERLRDELSGDPVPVRGSGLSSRCRGAWVRRGEQSRCGPGWQPITGQGSAGLAWEVSGWGRDHSALPSQPFLAEP